MLVGSVLAPKLHVGRRVEQREQLQHDARQLCIHQLLSLEIGNGAGT